MYALRDGSISYNDRIAQFEWFMDMSCKFRKVVAAVLKQYTNKSNIDKYRRK